MSNCTKATNFTAKDSLTTGDPGKLIKGSEIDAEYTAIATAITSKADTASPTFTGTPSAPTASFGTSTTQIATTAFVQAALAAMYPVGSIYTNASVSTNPATLFGFGTWEAFGEGRVAIGNGGGFTAGATGGSADATVVSHTHTLTSVTTNTTGSHNHTYTRPSGTSPQSGSDTQCYVSTTTSNTGDAGDHSHTLSGSTDSSGSSGTNANLQPYVVVYMWKRTA